MTTEYTVDAHDVPRRRLRNTGLAGAPFATVEDVVRWHGAMQAQEPRMAKWSVGQRCTGSPVEAELDHAVARGAIVRTHVLRPTWHFVASGDLMWLLRLTGPRIQQRNRRRYDQLGLDERTRGRCRALIASALEGGSELTRKEIAGVLGAAGIDTSGQRLPYVLMDAELEGFICSGAPRGTEHTYAALAERAPPGPGFDRDRALVELARRYLTSHGPATVHDLGWWSGLTVADIRSALDALGAEVTSDPIDDLTLWSISPVDDGAAGSREAHLLPTYDEFVVGYRASRYLGDPRAETARTAWSDRTLPSGVLLVDGAVAGHWRRRVSDAAIAIEVVTYDQLEPAQLRAVEASAAELGRFLGREPTLEVAAM